MTWFIVLLLLAGLGALAWYARGRRPVPGNPEPTLEESLSPGKAPPRPARESDTPLVWNGQVGNQPVASFPPAAPPPSTAGVDRERQALQKIAYGMVNPGVSEDDKLRFKQVMTEFAAADPLVRVIAERALHLVAANPGQLQSKIYVHFPGYDKEQVRYALYFAHELGLIYRKKKGNSYQLFPPGVTIDMK